MVAAKVLIIDSEVSGFYFLPSISGKKSIKVSAWRRAEGALYAGSYTGVGVGEGEQNPVARERTMERQCQHQIG